MQERGGRATGSRDGWAGRARPVRHAREAADAPPPRNTPTQQARRAPRPPRRAADASQKVMASWPSGRGATVLLQAVRARPAVAHAHPARTITPTRHPMGLSRAGQPPGHLAARPRHGGHAAQRSGRRRNGAGRGGILDLSTRWNMPTPPRRRRCSLTGWPRVPSVSAALPPAMATRVAVGETHAPPGWRRPRRGWRRRVGLGVRVEAGQRPQACVLLGDDALYGVDNVGPT